MEYIAKVTLYHNTKGLIEEGTTVEFTKEEVAEYDKDYFKDLFETVGAEEVRRSRGSRRGRTYTKRNVVRSGRNC